MQVQILIGCFFLLMNIAGLCQSPAIIARIEASAAAIDAREDLFAVTTNDTLPARYGRPAMILHETYHYDRKRNLHKIESRFQFPELPSKTRHTIVSYFSGKNLIKQIIRRENNGAWEQQNGYFINGKLSVTGDNIPIEAWMSITQSGYLYNNFRTIKRAVGPGGQPTKIPGTVVISQSVSMSTTEVTVFEWIEFIVNNGFDNTLFPDTTKISSVMKEVFLDLYKKQDFAYFRIVPARISGMDFDSLGVRTTKKIEELHEKHDVNYSLNAPITGVSYGQTLLFCKWAEDVLNRGRIIKLKVELPPVELYEQVITNVDSVNAKGCPIFNFQNCSCKLLTKAKQRRELVPDLEHGKALVRADAYWPTDLGLYNLQGNAAEMTSTPGVAMGGSFRHYAWESHRKHKQTYSGPEEWLGFRFIITIR